MTKKKIKRNDKKDKLPPPADLNTLLQHMLQIKNNLSFYSYSDIEERSRILRKELERLEEYDLLLTLYNWMIDTACQEEATNIEKEVLTDFLSVKKKAEINRQHLDCTSTANNLIKDAENGKPHRQLLLDSYNQLSKLLIKHTSSKLKHHTLINILRICPFLENRNKYIEPYIDFLRHHINDIIVSYPEDGHILFYSLAVFNKKESLFTRLAYIDKAIEQASVHLIPDKEIFYRIVKAKIYCDDGDFKSAFKELEVINHILHINEHFKEELKNVEALTANTSFLINFYLLLQGIQIESQLLKNKFQEFTHTGSHWLDFTARKNELHCLLMIKAGKRKKAMELIKEAFLIREKDNHPQLSHINLLLLELLRPNPQLYWINERIEELENSNELFYSSVWAGILKGLAGIIKIN